MSDRSEIAAGLVLSDDPRADRATVLAQAIDELRRRLHPSTVWQSAYLPPELSGGAAYGEEISRWSARDDVTPDEAQLLETAWSAALPPLDRGEQFYLRVRVDSPQHVRRLRAIGEVDGLIIVPSLDSRGRMRPLSWRWPFRVGVVPGPLADEWWETVRDTSHYETVFDAELFDAAGTYDIAIVSATELSRLPADVERRLGEAACVIVAGDGSVEELLMELDGRIEPAIAIAVAGPPDHWWRPFFHEMSHDIPIDAAVETIVRKKRVHALIAGPRYGMDITAAGRWFAAVAPDYPQLAPSLDEFARWNWRSEGGGATIETHQVRAERARGGDPVAFVPPPDMAAPEKEKVEKPSKPRRLVARVWDGRTLVKSILPPQRALNLAIGVAIPKPGDVAADEPAPALPAGPGPTVELEVVVSGDVWKQQPAPQQISISREKLSLPSTWAVFPFTTPDAGRVVSIEILLLYQGKPLQAATYVSPVRALAVPGERPTLRTSTLSGPDEPSEELQPVGVTLDGRGAELKRLHGSDAKVLITDVQEMLNDIEDRISRVLGVPGAPDSFNDEKALELLISLARRGVDLGTLLAPLDLSDVRSINLIVNATTRVLPLELVYAGPAPDKSARLCPHVAELPPSSRLEPPRAGQACTKASSRRVCPYAFWGLHRSIARTVQSEPIRGRKHKPPSPTLSASSVLYAATVIADDGAILPLPSASVFEAAKQAFEPATRVTSWTAWRRVVKSGKPNLLVVLGHTMVEGGETNLYIGKNSAIARARITNALLRADDSPPPLVLLIACATAALGDPFGSLPGTMAANGAGAVVATLSKIIGPHGAAATTHLLQTIHDLAGTDASVGDAVAAARRSLVAEQRPIGLILVSHGEVDTKLVP
jgi:hypothetical protein